ncbi:MBL fold metallo-hydrolase [Bacillus suaedae]|uniref:MBL fold metallo-hydrolase n=1 Tax=Halalkalibacter suaedae TaxID=2822140 RepID=A0A941ANQ2_9BACI|nr:MBL fold metallo-hydrolase [Bacillus suaedae]MBP3951041.1 MBL fold metallo-hydrolase [Bacillus suaedae]
MDQQMHYGSDNKYIPVTSLTDGLIQTIAPEVSFLTVQVVNLCIVGNPTEANQWFLIDAGMPKSATRILNALEEHFGTIQPPKAIILTHGHFDHVGALIELTEKWDVPIFAHEAEFPYLTGETSYPEPDPTVEGGLVAKMSPLFPNEPIQVSTRLKPLPTDHSIPSMSEWRWIHTPGHSPGHISLYREKDGVLIAGDAFVTVKQDSLYKVLTQTKELSGPPRYLTTDWEAARESVQTLEALKPTMAITGHGLPMYGVDLETNLNKLANHFDEIAKPDYGRYVH